MTDIMTLDLNAGPNEGLLRPFGIPSVRNDETQALFTQKKEEPRGGFGFFRRRSNPEPEPPAPEQEEKVTLKATTFAFPNARVEVADVDPKPVNKEREEQPQDDGEVKESDDNDEYEYVYETEDEDETQVKTATLKKIDDWDPSDNPYYVEEERENRPFNLVGFGNTPDPRKEEPLNPLGRFWRRFREGVRDEEDSRNMKTMKVATEDTKDEKTLVEKVAKAALVVLVPELYAEDEDGDDNLGMYRSICTRSDEDVLRVDPHIALKSENIQLRRVVLKMDKQIKSIQLERDSWRQRCKELESELRQYRGQSLDDSSVVFETDEDEDDGDEIEAEWTGEEVKEGILIEFAAEDKPDLVFDPLEGKKETESSVEPSALLDLVEPRDEQKSSNGAVESTPAGCSDEKSADVAEQRKEDADQVAKEFQC